MNLFEFVFYQTPLRFEARFTIPFWVPSIASK
jgi:hypothetical protein